MQHTQWLTITKQKGLNYSGLYATKWLQLWNGGLNSSRLYDTHKGLIHNTLNGQQLKQKGLNYSGLYDAHKGLNNSGLHNTKGLNKADISYRTLWHSNRHT